ncbi:sulfite exporter TauE/SafE family protein [Nioella nitratireducens]|uniref:sulfite exporter TauE/SafE family protein n=1 Tax=Nioella nitratireducens TaxID=1287720 RepID=UPI0008FD34BF|nr:sulfite exporter TauE/SafE family protein [Nioella nitratireducens]
MPEIFGSALTLSGLIWLAVTALVAGVVRGFSGFGTAMIYMPVAGQILTPVGALVTLTVMDVIGPLPNVPRAIKDGNKRDLMRLCAGLVVALPIGILALTRLPVEAFRYGVSGIALVLLGLLISGWRYHGRLTPPLVVGTGMLGGFLGGATGLAGPPVIMLYMASNLPARVVRASLLLYLVGVDVLMIGTLGIMGHLSLATVAIGAVLILPYMAGNIAGGWLFRPKFERGYRWVAYGLISVSALSGLPLFD